MTILKLLNVFLVAGSIQLNADQRIAVDDKETHDLFRGVAVLDRAMNEIIWSTTPPNDLSDPVKKIIAKVKGSCEIQVSGNHISHELTVQGHECVVPARGMVTHVRDEAERSLMHVQIDSFVQSDSLQKELYLQGLSTSSEVEYERQPEKEIQTTTTNGRVKGFGFGLVPFKKTVTSVFVPQTNTEEISVRLSYYIQNKSSEIFVQHSGSKVTCEINGTALSGNDCTRAFYLIGYE